VKSLKDSKSEGTIDTEIKPHINESTENNSMLVSESLPDLSKPMSKDKEKKNETTF